MSYFNYDKKENESNVLQMHFEHYHYILGDSNMMQYIDGDFFGDYKELGKTYEVAKAYYYAKRKPPTYSALITEMNERGVDIDHTLMQELYGRPFYDDDKNKQTIKLDHIRERVFTHYKWVQFSKQIRSIVEKVGAVDRNPRIESINSTIHEIRASFISDTKTKLQAKTQSTDFFDIDNHRERSMSRYPTGYSYIDKIAGGGYWRGSLWVFVGSPKTGKSFVLQNLAVRSVNNGDNTAYISLELPKVMCMHRIGAAMFRKPINQYKDFVHTEGLSISMQDHESYVRECRLKEYAKLGIQEATSINEVIKKHPEFGQFRQIQNEELKKVGGFSPVRMDGYKFDKERTKNPNIDYTKNLNYSFDDFESEFTSNSEVQDIELPELNLDGSIVEDTNPKNNITPEQKRKEYQEIADIEDENTRSSPEGRGQMHIFKYESGVATVPMIEIDLLSKESEITALTGKPFKFRNIYLDYLNIMREYRNPNTENLYQKIKSISEDLRAMAERNGWCVISATQTNKNQYGSDDISASDVSESSALNATVDMMVGIIKTDRMDISNEMILKCIYTRGSGESLLCGKFTIDRMNFALDEDEHTEYFRIDDITHDKVTSYAESRNTAKIVKKDGGIANGSQQINGKDNVQTYTTSLIGLSPFDKQPPAISKEDYMASITKTHNQQSLPPENTGNGNNMGYSNSMQPSVNHQEPIQPIINTQQHNNQQNTIVQEVLAQIQTNTIQQNPTTRPTISRNQIMSTMNRTTEIPIYSVDPDYAKNKTYNEIVNGMDGMIF